MKNSTETQQLINRRMGYTICIYCSKAEQRNDGYISYGSCMKCANTTMVLKTEKHCPTCGQIIGESK